MTIHQRIERILKIIGIVGALLIVLFIGLIILSNIVASPGTHTTAPEPTSIPTVVPTATVDVSQSPAYQLALDDNHYATPSPAMVAAYQKVLDSLQAKTGDDQTTIADETVKGLTELQGKGIDDTCLQLMQAVDTIYTKNDHTTYHDALSSLIAVLENA
jgi:hypothetical protein